MNLNNSEKQTLMRGETVIVNVDGVECVLLRRDVYDQVTQTSPYDDSQWSDQEKRDVLRHIGKRAGWDDPESTAGQIRSAGFEILPDSTNRFPNHARIKHPNGVSGFDDADLNRLAKAFQETKGC